MNHNLRSEKNTFQVLLWFMVLHALTPSLNFAGDDAIKFSNSEEIPNFLPWRKYNWFMYF